MKHRLDKLIELARRGRPACDVEVPHGFATRVAAGAFTPAQPSLLPVLERIGKWGIACAIMACVLTATFHQKPKPDQSGLAEFAAFNMPGERLW